MATSLPSREICSFDVPEVKSFEADFQYNFFVADEKISETGGIPQGYLQKSSVELGVISADPAAYDFASRKIPRCVKLRWRLPKIRFPGNSKRYNETDLPDHHGRNLGSDFIYRNRDKIIFEDRLSTDTYVSVNFQDASIDKRIYHIVSGAYEQLTTIMPSLIQNDPIQKALIAEELAPPGVNPEFMIKALDQTDLSMDMTIDNRQKRKRDQYIEKLRTVSVNAQFNVSVAPTLLKVASTKPWSSTSDYFDTLASNVDIYSRVKKLTAGVNDNDYKTFLPFVRAIMMNSGNTRSPSPAQLVGYILHKAEIKPNGEVSQRDDIYVESSQVSMTIDPKVKYDAVYNYSIRAVYLLSLTAIDQDTMLPAIIEILVASRPSQKEFVTCEERKSPPPPVDFKMTWDWDRPNTSGRLGSLMLHWSFPPNSQRDIKKFHVLRRKSIDEPFQIIRVFDFDDSVIKTEDPEEYDSLLVTVDNNPQSYFYDDEFNKENKYIYAVSCQDAHGFISAYSMQFEVSFDKFKNSLVKRFISSAGAPRPYPNLFLAKDMFVDTLRVSGEKSKTLTICFDPEYYGVIDTLGRPLMSIGTVQEGTKYRLQFINLNNQKDCHVDVVIDDPQKITDPSDSRISR